MKRILFLCIPLIFFFSCEEEDSATGYSCTENDCFAEEGGQYATLEDCLSVCDNNSTLRYNCSPESGCFQIEADFGEYDSLEECEDVCSQCNCGEVVDIDYYPAFAGNYLLDTDPNSPTFGDVIVVGDHAAYSITEVQMNCSGEMISLCNDLEMGELFCFDYVGDCYFAECVWTEDVVFFDVNQMDFIVEDMLLQNITLDDGYITLGSGGSMGETVPYDCE